MTSADGTVAVKVALPVGVLERLDSVAAQEELTRSQLFLRALTEYLDEREDPDYEAKVDAGLLKVMEERLEAGEECIPWEQAKQELGL